MIWHAFYAIFQIQRQSLSLTTEFGNTIMCTTGQYSKMPSDTAVKKILQTGYQALE